MALCLKNGWNFSITFKPSDMPALWDEGQRLLALVPGQTQTVTLPQDKGLRVMRLMRRKRDNSPFWGCGGYPGCRGTLPFKVLAQTECL